MHSSFGKQILGLVGFTVFGLGLFAGLFYMANHFQPGSVSVAQADDRIQDGRGQPGDTLILQVDATRRTGKTWLTYRGKIDADHFVIDVTIPELDPQTYYSHKLNIADARKGFILVGQTYRLVRVNRTGIRLKQG